MSVTLKFLVDEDNVVCQGNGKDRGATCRYSEPPTNTTDYVLKRYALAGNSSDWVARIEEIAQAGATKLWGGVGGGDLDRQLLTMRLLGEQVMARFV